MLQQMLSQHRVLSACTLSLAGLWRMDREYLVTASGKKLQFPARVTRPPSQNPAGLIPTFPLRWFLKSHSNNRWSTFSTLTFYSEPFLGKTNQGSDCMQRECHCFLGTWDGVSVHILPERSAGPRLLSEIHPVLALLIDTSLDFPEKKSNHILGCFTKRKTICFEPCVIHFKAILLYQVSEWHLGVDTFIFTFFL